MSAIRVGRYRFAMACTKASTTIRATAIRYGFMNRNNLIILLHLHSDYRYIVFSLNYNDISYSVKGSRVYFTEALDANWLPVPARQGPPAQLAQAPLIRRAEIRALPRS